MRQTIPKVTGPATNGKSEDGSLGSLGLDDSTTADTYGATDLAYRNRDGSSTGARRRRWRILLAVAVVAVVAIALGFFLLQPTASALTATVQRGSIVSSVETTGKLEAGTSA